MELRINEIAKSRNIQLKDISKTLGITYASFYRRLKSPSLKSLEEIAAVLNCEIAELLPVGSGFAHFYDQSGKWQGIRRI